MKHVNIVNAGTKTIILVDPETREEIHRLDQIERKDKPRVRDERTTIETFTLTDTDVDVKISVLDVQFIQDLPPQKEGTYYLVPPYILSELRDRTDIIAPYRPKTDKNGNLICSEFTHSSVPSSVTREELVIEKLKLREQKEKNKPKEEKKNGNKQSKDAIRIQELEYQVSSLKDSIIDYKLDRKIVTSLQTQLPTGQQETISLFKKLFYMTGFIEQNSSLKIGQCDADINLKKKLQTKEQRQELVDAVYNCVPVDSVTDLFNLSINDLNHLKYEKWWLHLCWDKAVAVTSTMTTPDKTHKRDIEPDKTHEREIDKKQPRKFTKKEQLLIVQLSQQGLGPTAIGKRVDSSPQTINSCKKSKWFKLLVEELTHKRKLENESVSKETVIEPTTTLLQSDKVIIPDKPHKQVQTQINEQDDYFNNLDLVDPVHLDLIPAIIECVISGYNTDEILAEFEQDKLDRASLKRISKSEEFKDTLNMVRSEQNSYVSIAGEYA